MDKAPTHISSGMLALQNGATAVKETVGSVVAGVGSVMPATKIEVARPTIADPASDRAFEEYKRYSAQTSTNADERRMWSGMIDRLMGLVMFGAAAGLGVSAAASAGGWMVALPMLLGAAAISVASYYFFQRPAVQAQSNKSMDVSDFQIKRQAALIAKEIKTEFTKDVPPQLEDTKQTAAGTEEPGTKVSAPTAVLASETARLPVQGKRTWQQVVADTEATASVQIH